MTPEIVTEIRDWSCNTYEIFASKIEYGDEDACWMWTGPVSRYNGKAFFYMPDLLVPVQDVIYWIDCDREGVPDERGKVVPLCGSPLCCNPQHLALTEEESEKNS